MIRNETITIKEGGVRLDAALLHAFPTTTRAFVREAIGGGKIFICRDKSVAAPTVAKPNGDATLLSRHARQDTSANGDATLLSRATDKGLKLKPNTTLVIRELLEACDNLVAPAGDCPPPVYEDDELLAFDKPCAMPVQPLSCRETGTLANAVATRFPECRPLGDRPLLGGALHRIDADTSGLVLFARTAEAFENVRAQFAAQTVKKTYLALVEGSVAVGGTLENDLIHDPTQTFCRMVDAHHNRLTRAQMAGLKPLHAVTNFNPIAHTTVENEERTLLEVTIYTGVTHQIRAQLALAGLHIINDRLYGAFAVENQIGHCLHAYATELKHPTTGESLKIATDKPSWAMT